MQDIQFGKDGYADSDTVRHFFSKFKSYSIDLYIGSCSSKYYISVTIIQKNGNSFFGRNIRITDKQFCSFDEIKKEIFSISQKNFGKIENNKDLRKAIIILFKSIYNTFEQLVFAY